jgi:antitoxin Phd
MGLQFNWSVELVSLNSQVRQELCMSTVLLPPFPSPGPSAWRLQDAKAQFSALVDHALRGVPQHVTRRGQPAVVVLAQQDFEALQRSAAGHSGAANSFVAHLLAIPTEKASEKISATKRPGKKAARLDVQPRELDFS